MNKVQLEYQVRTIVDQAKAGNKIEDTTVELKAQWPDDEQKAARLLAAHANAARGEPILWIIGVDENRKSVVAVEQKELSDWWRSVSGKFEGSVSPGLLISVPVQIDGQTLVALYFATGRAPYVVPNFAKVTGPVDLEVPWREGNSTRSARRGDLVRLLVPVTRLPTIEVLKAEITWKKFSDGNERWTLEVELYAVPIDEKPVFFPAHKWSGEFLHVYTGETLPLRLMPRIEDKPEGYTTHDQIKCAGPMRFGMTGESTFPAITQSFPDIVRAKIRLGIAGEATLSKVLDFEMSNQERTSEGLIWSQKPIEGFAI